MKNLTVRAKEIYEANKAKGFYDEKRSFGDVCTLIISEVVEAYEETRKKNARINPSEHYLTLIDRIDSNDEFKHYFEQYIKDTVADELADTIIRVLDYCGHQGIDIEKHIELKLRYNALRPYKHGKSK